MYINDWFNIKAFFFFFSLRAILSLLYDNALAAESVLHVHSKIWILKEIQLRTTVPLDACTHLIAIWSYESRTIMSCTFPITYSKRVIKKKKNQ